MPKQALGWFPYSLDLESTTLEDELHIHILWSV